jgi:hypothetical protein
MKKTETKFSEKTTCDENAVNPKKIRQIVTA